jgi:hypothetical protein
MYFFPAAFTSGCTIETKAFADASDDFKKAGATLIGVAADPIERPAVGALVFKYMLTGSDNCNGQLGEERPVILDWGKDENGDVGFVGRRTYPTNTVIRCDATGMACVLIHRSVFERMIEAYPAIAYVAHHPHHADPAQRVERLHKFFDWPLVRNPDGDVEEWSEDFDFCRKWRLLGGRIWLEPEIRLTHWGPQGWSGSVYDHIEMRERPGADATPKELEGTHNG